MIRNNRIQSSVRAIAKLVIYPIPIKPVLVNACVRFDDCIVLVDTAGKIYSTAMMVRQYWLKSMKNPKLFKGLVKLGIVSADDVAQHEAEIDAQRIARDRKNASTWILESVTSAGLKLSPKQHQQLLDQMAVDL